jgi:hypothetical protein
VQFLLDRAGSRTTRCFLKHPRFAEIDVPPARRDVTFIGRLGQTINRSDGAVEHLISAILRFSSPLLCKPGLRIREELPIAAITNAECKPARALEGGREGGRERSKAIESEHSD